MSLSTDREKLHTSAYFLVRRSGFLSSALGRPFFRSAYSVYKRDVEDDLNPIACGRENELH